jgi:hypothetical protein
VRNRVVRNRAVRNRAVRLNRKLPAKIKTRRNSPVSAS